MLYLFFVMFNLKFTCLFIENFGGSFFELKKLLFEV
jgi:hypothetical protein